jgi:hypothetical protein
MPAHHLRVVSPTNMDPSMTAPHSPIKELCEWLKQWTALGTAANTVRSLRLAAARGPLLVEQTVLLQRNVEFIRAVACDEKLDALFLPRHEYEEYAAMHDQPLPATPADIDDLVRELGEMYRNDPDRGTETEACYYTAAERTNAIGAELHRRGGLMAMGKAHDAILREHGNGAAGMLRNQWCNSSVCGWSIGWTLPATA